MVWQHDLGQGARGRHHDARHFHHAVEGDEGGPDAEPCRDESVGCIEGEEIGHRGKKRQPQHPTIIRPVLRTRVVAHQAGLREHAEDDEQGKDRRDARGADEEGEMPRGERQRQSRQVHQAMEDRQLHERQVPADGPSCRLQIKGPQVDGEAQEEEEHVLDPHRRAYGVQDRRHQKRDREDEARVRGDHRSDLGTVSIFGVGMGVLQRDEVRAADRLIDRLQVEADRRQEDDLGIASQGQDARQHQQLEQRETHVQRGVEGVQSAEAEEAAVPSPAVRCDDLRTRQRTTGASAASTLSATSTTSPGRRSRPPSA